ncbi:hypothetical protein V8E51_019324 [Hyaloscypha variabilis]
MNYFALLFSSLLLARPVLSFADPINSGDKYILSSEVTGNLTYLGCGDDFLCSMLDLSGAQEHDGVTPDEQYGVEWQFLIRDGAWALDVMTVNQTIDSVVTGQKIFANNNTAGGRSQLWNLVSQEDGAYELNNVQYGGALDVADNVTPFVNPDAQPDGQLKGQYWTFKSVYPQVTSTVTSTTTSTINAFAGSTVTVTTTVCPQKRADVSGTPLERRQAISGTATGTALLETTTVTTTNLVTVTETVSSSTSEATATHIVTACGSTSSAAAKSTGAAGRGREVHGGMMVGALCVGMGVVGVF